MLQNRNAMKELAPCTCPYSVDMDSLPGSRSAMMATLVAMLLLTGCGTTASPTAGEPTSLPSIEPVVETVVTAPPESLVPLDCAELLPGSDLTSTTGKTMVLGDDPYDPVTFAEMRQVGDVSCRWEGTNSTVLLSISRNVAMRATEVEPWPMGTAAEKGTLGAETSALICVEGAGNPHECTATAVLGDYDILAYLAGEYPGVPMAQVTKLFRTLISGAISRLAAVPQPALWTAPEGSWPLLADCGAIEEGGNIAAALKNPALVVSRAGGPEQLPTSPEYDEVGGSTNCQWRADAPLTEKGGVEFFTLTTLAGGAWYWDVPTPGFTGTVEEVDIDGTENAAIRCLDDNCSLDARMGNNAFRIHSAYMAPSLTREQLIAGARAAVTGIRSSVD